jgi:hypothetical protein
MTKKPRQEARMDKAIALGDRLQEKYGSLLGAISTEIAKAVKDRPAKQKLGRMIDGLALELYVEIEELARFYYGHEAYRTGRHAAEKTLATATARANRGRPERDRDINAFIDQQHAQNVPKETILERLMELYGKRRDGHGKWDKDEAGAETGYPLSKDVLRKMESARRRATKKAPGSG